MPRRENYLWRNYKRYQKSMEILSNIDSGWPWLQQPLYIITVIFGKRILLRKEI